MEFKGTKGNWRLRNEHNLIFVESPKEEINQPYGQEILADDYFNEEERIYDALLISKAPEMLEILKRILKIISEGHGSSFDGSWQEWESELNDVTKECEQLIKEATTK